MNRRYVQFFVMCLLAVFLYGCPDTEEAALLEEVVPETEVVEKANITFFHPEHEVIFMVPRGDTLIFHSGKEIALIGVKSPERGEPCFEESKDGLEGLVLDRNVTLHRDVLDMNSYGRYLRYVFINDVFVNEAMIRSGLARYEYPELDSDYSSILYEAEIDAMSNRLCLWKDLKTDPCLFVAFFNYDAEGVDEFNLNDEFVTFRNICEARIDLTGWTVQNSEEMYQFPEFVLGPEAAVTLHSGEGQDSRWHLYWGKEISVWDDESDTLYLRNPEGDLIVRYHY